MAPPAVSTVTPGEEESARIAAADAVGIVASSAAGEGITEKWEAELSPGPREGGPIPRLADSDAVPDRPSTLGEVTSGFPHVAAWVMTRHARGVACAVRDLKLALCHSPREAK